MKEIELLLNHRHNGFDYQKGEVIEVTAHDADWLCQRGIAKPFIKKTEKEVKQHD